MREARSPSRSRSRTIHTIHTTHTRKPYSRDVISQLVEGAGRRMVYYYQKTDEWLYQALRDHPVEGQSVLIVVSEHASNVQSPTSNIQHPTS